MKSTLENKLLNIIPFSRLDKWYVSYYLNPFSLESRYSFEKLSQILIPVKNRIQKDDYDGRIPVISKISFNDGKIHLRDENKTGMDLYILEKGQLLVSKINFHQGAVAINNKEQLVCSTHYQPYEINSDLITEEFLILVLRSSPFLNFIRYLRADGIKNEATFEFIGGLEIPLPNKNDQIRIVEAYNKTLQLAEKTKKKATEIEESIQSYLSAELGIEKGKRKVKSFGLQTISFKEINRWALSYLFKEQRFSMDKVKYPIVPLKTLVTFFKGGKTPSTSRKDFWDGDIYWTSAKDMKSLILNSVQDKITEQAVNEARLEIYPKGTILGVFRSGILRHSFPVAITKIETTINQDLKAIGVNEEAVLKEYFLFYLKTFQKMILERAQKFGVTVESINSDEFLEIPIVLPPIQTQIIIVDTISQMLNKVNSLKSDSILLRRDALKEFEKEIFEKCN